ncbi:glycine oxidase ThiO [Mammaliicoccus vitulinus]|uniref:glycine oxidase ThiO n=1 Tax=Mammaliicoccus vitulinus TaxID=71237 RepID=UPI003F9AFF94
MYDVVIIGSGVIGMSIARTLSDKDSLSIAVIDRDVPGLHASYKAGGMLGAQNEFVQDTALYQLALRSRDYFKSLSQDLYKETNINIDYQEHGLIKMAASEDDIECLKAQYHFLNQRDRSVTTLSENSLKDLCNDSIEFNHHAIYIPNDGQINASKYTKALLKSINNKGIDRLYHTEVKSLKRLKDCYKVQTSHSILLAKKVVVAGGAWSNDLLENYQIEPKVTGVKGEVLLLEHEHLNLKQTLFMTNGCYIVPKRGNRFLVGATSYVDDYSVGTSTEGEQWLFNKAAAYIPLLNSSNIIHKWSGIRPYTDHEWPIMDEIDNGLFLVTGHYRNGILLSPIIGKLMSEWIVNDQPPSLIKDFKAKRSVHL